MRRVTHNTSNRTAHPLLLRVCGAGSLLGGILFLVWGYIDRPNVSENLRFAIHALALAVPTLFLVGVVGVLTLCGRQVGVLGWAGIALALYGSGLAAVSNLVDVGALLDAYFAERGWAALVLTGWIADLSAGLALVGMATIGTRTLRGLGTLALAIGVFGLGYDLTDGVGSVAFAAPRWLHIGFGLLFSLGWVTLGPVLWE